MDRLLTEVLGKRKRRDSSGKKGRKKGKSQAPTQPQRVTNEQEMNQLQRDALHILRKSRTSKMKNTKKQLHQVDTDLDQSSPSSPEHQTLLTKQEYLTNQLELLRQLDVNDILQSKISNIKEESETKGEEAEEMAKLQERIASVPNLHPLLTRIAELQLSYERTMEKKRKKKLKQKEPAHQDSQSESEAPDSPEGSSDDDEPQSIPQFLRPVSKSKDGSSNESDQSDDADNSFDSAEDLGVTEGFTIQVPSFGAAYSESDSDGAIDIRDRYSDAELDDPEYDEAMKQESGDSDLYSSSDDDEDAIVQAELARLAQMDGPDEGAAQESSSSEHASRDSDSLDDFESSMDGTSEIEMNLSPARKQAKRSQSATPHTPTKATPTKPTPKAKRGKESDMTATENIFIGSLDGGKNSLLPGKPAKNTPKKKKNRPGQNARRAEREQMLRAQARESRDRRFRSGDRERPNYKDSPRRENRVEQSSRRDRPRSNERRAPRPAPTPAPVEQKPEDLASLHPSWAARKKETSIADFQGKKKTFDSDSE